MKTLDWRVSAKVRDKGSTGAFLKTLTLTVRAANLPEARGMFIADAHTKGFETGFLLSAKQVEEVRS